MLLNPLSSFEVVMWIAGNSFDFFLWVSFIQISQPIAQKINWHGLVVLTYIFDSPIDSLVLRQSFFTWKYAVRRLNQPKPRAIKATSTRIWIFIKIHSFCTRNQYPSFLTKPGSSVTETALFSKFLPRDLRSRRVHTNPDEKICGFKMSGLVWTWLKSIR